MENQPKEPCGSELPKDLPFQVEAHPFRDQWKGSAKMLDRVKEGSLQNTQEHIFSCRQGLYPMGLTTRSK